MLSTLVNINMLYLIAVLILLWWSLVISVGLVRLPKYSPIFWLFLMRLRKSQLTFIHWRPAPQMRLLTLHYLPQSIISFLLISNIISCSVPTRICHSADLHQRNWTMASLSRLRLNSIHNLISIRPLVIYHKLRSCSFVIIYLQTWSYEIFIVLRKLNIRLEQLIYRSIRYLLK